MKTKYLKCDCDASNSEINTEEVSKFTSKTIYESFYDTLKFSNYRVLLCYKLPFRINSITTNKGSIMAIIYFCLYLIFLSIFCIKGITQFKLFIAKEINENPKNENDDIILNSNIDNKQQIGNKVSSNGVQKIIKSTSKKIRINSYSKNDLQKKISNFNMLTFPPKKNLKKFPKFKNMNPKQNISYERKLSDHNLLITNKLLFLNKKKVLFNEQSIEKKVDEISEVTNTKKLDHFELNDLNYEEALKLDTRNFFEMYWSLLRREHLITIKL
jgi:hypothetical protein